MRAFYIPHDQSLFLWLNYGYLMESLAGFEKFQLIEKNGEYLKILHEILGLLYVPTMKLQKLHHPTISERIPTIFTFLEKLESLKNIEASRGILLIADDLEKAREKLLEYYPANDDSQQKTLSCYST